MRKISGPHWIKHSHSQFAGFAGKQRSENRFDRDGSQLLFRVISDSYESKSLLLTTNLEFSKWGSIFTDDQMAAAMIDRLVHHGHLILNMPFV